MTDTLEVPTNYYAREDANTSLKHQILIDSIEALHISIELIKICITALNLEFVNACSIAQVLKGYTIPELTNIQEGLRKL